jgi:hypothetical protein
MFRLLLTLLTLSFFIYSCEKNTELTPNPAFKPESNNEVSNGDDTVSGGNGEGTKDSTSTQLHFRADINGNLTSFPTRDVLIVNSTNSTQVQIIGGKDNGNVFEKISIYIINEDIIEGDTLYFDGSGADTRGEYFSDNGTNFYTFHSDNGYIVFNRVTSLLYGAKFRFKASSSASDSSIYITNGAFLINRN